LAKRRRSAGVERGKKSQEKNQYLKRAAAKDQNMGRKVSQALIKSTQEDGNRACPVPFGEDL